MKKSIIIAIVFILIDQLSKWYVLQNIMEEMFLISDWFSIVVRYNEGIAFSISIFNEFITPLVGILIICGSLAAWKYLDWRNSWYLYSFSCILAGACGNFLDRLIHGHVVDFIKIGWWPVFNIADSFITIGVVTILIHELFIHPKKEINN